MGESFHLWSNQKPQHTTIESHQEERGSLHTGHDVQVYKKQNLETVQ